MNFVENVVCTVRFGKKIGNAVDIVFDITGVTFDEFDEDEFSESLINSVNQYPEYFLALLQTSGDKKSQIFFKIANSVIAFDPNGPIPPPTTRPPKGKGKGKGKDTKQFVPKGKGDSNPSKGKGGIIGSGKSGKMNDGGVMTGGKGKYHWYHSNTFGQNTNSKIKSFPPKSQYKEDITRFTELLNLQQLKFKGGRR